MEPVRSRDEALVEGVLKTIKRGKFVPAEVRVKGEACRLVLLPLKERFGFELRVSKRLPALEFAESKMQKTLHI